MNTAPRPCLECGKTIFPPGFNPRDFPGMAPPQKLLDGTTNYCECRPAVKDGRIAGTENKGAPAPGDGWRQVKG